MIIIFTYTDRGRTLAKTLREGLLRGGYVKEEILLFHKAKDDGGQNMQHMQTYMKQGNVLLFIGAAGIAVRMIAPYLTDKARDPAVLVMDDTAKHVVSLLSGHLGGANEWAHAIAGITGAVAVITTATDCNGVWAVDNFAVKNRLRIADIAKIKHVSAKLLHGEKVSVWAETVLERMQEKLLQDAGGLCYPAEEIQKADIILTNTIEEWMKKQACLVMVPMDIIIGIGCKQGKTAQELYGFIQEVCKREKIDMYRIRSIHSIEQKKQEKGILQVADILGVPFMTYTSEELARVEGEFSHSTFVENAVGVDNVCERSAAAEGARLWIKKQVRDGMTLAFAKEG